ncbi:MAG: glycine--tRNA ligase subunit beta [Rhodospirillales bacterium]|nr:glycine--tRNA ligase subunit beta [Rhodospirillales bacterium]
MAELLLELFSEEIPARMQLRAADDLKRLVTASLKKAGLEFSEANAYVTPRRLALVVDGLPKAQPDVSEERRGPRADAPEKAMQGFLGSVGLTLDQCEKRETKKGEFWFAVIEKKGRPTMEVLKETLPEAVNALPWPKSMRWGSHEPRWVRPLHSIIALFGNEVVPFSYGSIESGKQTRGHRFMAPDAFEVKGFEDYKAKLRAAKVILKTDERREFIKEQAKALASEENLFVVPDENLFTEVAGLVEWPVVLMGKIDESFMDVPPEVLTLSMATHQKYFSVIDREGQLASRFIVVANREGSDGGKAITAGNERVLKARLSDCKFFWDQDRKKTLEDFLPSLKDIVFHAKLGTLDEKMVQVEELAVDLCAFIPGSDALRARRAAHIAKADLVSDMVYELPEVQGVMGRYYALHNGENSEVANAIAEHYSPLGPSDDCPSAPVSIAVSMADKIDTLAGFWVINEKPTGSKDPFALRRAALGVIRLILENKLRLPLRQAFLSSLSQITAVNPETGSMDKVPHETWEGVVDSLIEFFADRLKVHLKEKGVRHDLVSAVFALGNEDDMVRLLARVEALKGFLDTDDGANLLAASKRAGNILRIEEKKDSQSYEGTADPALFSLDEEKALHSALADVGAKNKNLLEQEDYVAVMGNLSVLRGPVDAFFDKVTVNSENANERVNRLKLLSQIRSALGEVAEFSEIEG